MNVTEAVENYLEAILVLAERHNEVRATDICAYMGYSRPTVSIAVKGMKNNGLILVDEHNLITLTDAGLQIANGIYERHNVLAQALMHLGVDQETAFEDACKMEHDISEKTFSCIKLFLRNLDQYHIKPFEA